MSKTPRTNTAAYNGYKYLLDECAALEIENRKLRDVIEQVAHCATTEPAMTTETQYDIRADDAAALEKLGNPFLLPNTKAQT